MFQNSKLNMNISRPSCNFPRQRGFSMIEVLVTMLVVALALLGAAGLQAFAMQLNQGGQFRVQAVFLAADLAERMEANRAAAVSGAYAAANSSTPNNSTNACTTSVCTSAEVADNDLSEWQTAISRTLPQGSWVVTQSTVGNPSVYTIVISWIDRRSNTSYATSGSGETYSYTATRAVLN
jgi:type IV pilus assembly protein PilV